MEVVGAAVGQFPLGQRPDSLIGVELGCVGREMLDVETRMLALELVQGLPLGGARVIQKRNPVATGKAAILRTIAPNSRRVR